MSDAAVMHMRNGSVSLILSGIALDHANRIVLLDVAPQHPKKVGAIWAEMVSGNPRSMQFADEAGHTHNVYGKGSAYVRIAMEAPEIQFAEAARARPLFLRMVFPTSLRIPTPKAKEEIGTFYVFEWPDLSAGRALAAMLERDTQLPLMLDWGDALLQRGIEMGFITPLITAGTSPRGYEIRKPGDGWEEFISLTVTEKTVTVA